MLKQLEFETWTVLAAAVEIAATGLVLFSWPSLFAWLVFNAEFHEAGRALAGLTGIALLGLAFATWPVTGATRHLTSSVRVLLSYNGLAAIYLLYVGINTPVKGILLWPAIALHATFSILLSRAWFSMRNTWRDEKTSRFGG